MVRWASVWLLLMALAVPTGLAAAEVDRLALLVKALEKVENPTAQAALLRGMLTGLAGRRDVKPPPGWGPLAEKFAKSKHAEVVELAAQLSQVFGDEAATAKALETIRDKQAPPDTRRRLLHSLLTQRNKAVRPLLVPLLEEEGLRRDAIRGFAVLETPDAARLLLAHYRKWPPADRKAVIETLATRKPYARSLVAALKQGKVSRDDIPAHVARALDLLLGDAFRSVFGKVQTLAKDRSEQIAKYKKLLEPKAVAGADARQGRIVFNKTCGACHKLYGVGGDIGPDLTGSNRANLDYLLLNSIDPSYDVPEGYRMVNIHTVDGLALSGVIAEENAQRIVLKTVDQPRVVILKSDIELRAVPPKSMMPEGQLDQLKPRDVLNLVKYLQSIEQVELPE